VPSAHVPCVYHMLTKIGVYKLRSSHFPFRARTTHTDTHTVTDATDHRIHASAINAGSSKSRRGLIILEMSKKDCNFVMH